MSDLLMNSDGDVDITAGNASLVSGPDEVVQLLHQRLRTFKGEWFLDNTVGVPYYDVIFKKRPSPSLVRSVLISEVINTPGVLELLSFEDVIETSTRQLSVEFSARIEDRIINFSEVLG